MKYTDRCWANHLKALEKAREFNKVKNIIIRASMFLLMGVFCYYSWLGTIFLGSKIANNWGLIKYTISTILN